MTRSTTENLKETLRKISVMDFGPDVDVSTLESSDALALIVDMALDALNPKSKPSAFDLKTDEVTNFMMSNFDLVFATNSEIADALNKAGIATAHGKDWTTSNISKTMTSVRGKIVNKVRSENSATSVSNDTPVVTTVDTSKEEVVTEKAPESVLEVTSDQDVDTQVSDEDIDDILSELDIDELSISS